MNTVVRFGIISFGAMFIGCSNYQYIRNCGESEYKVSSLEDSVFVVRVSQPASPNDRVRKKATFLSLDCMTERIVDECCRRSSAVCLRKEMLRFNVKDYLSKSNAIIEQLPDSSTFIINTIPSHQLDSLIISTYR